MDNRGAVATEHAPCPWGSTPSGHPCISLLDFPSDIMETRDIPNEKTVPSTVHDAEVYDISSDNEDHPDTEPEYSTDSELYPREEVKEEYPWSSRYPRGEAEEHYPRRYRPDDSESEVSDDETSGAPSLGSRYASDTDETSHVHTITEESVSESQTECEQDI